MKSKQVAPVTLIKCEWPLNTLFQIRNFSCCTIENLKRNRVIFKNVSDDLYQHIRLSYFYFQMRLNSPRGLLFTPNFWRKLHNMEEFGTKGAYPLGPRRSTTDYYFASFELIRLFFGSSCRCNLGRLQSFHGRGLKCRTDRKFQCGMWTDLKNHFGAHKSFSWGH